MNCYEIWYRPYQKGRRHMQRVKVNTGSRALTKLAFKLVYPTAQLIAVWPVGVNQRQVG